MVIVPASGSNRVMHSFEVPAILPLILPDRIKTAPGPVTVQPATEPFTRISVEVAVPPTASGGSIDAVPTTVLHVIEWFDTSIRCADPVSGPSRTNTGTQATRFILAPPFRQKAPSWLRRRESTWHSVNRVARCSS